MKTCTCPMCCACCPDMRLLALLNQLKREGVCPEVAAQVAGDFVARMPCSPVPSDMKIEVTPKP